ncbi:MAG: ornithine--oxo-acid transaminase [Candidatus Tectomicrobia bacterium]|uniref:ornithine aminotransferase n=1 Tax=Tectimicrobiota bacterium TaxID=2528274 RepID=A0A932FVM7_UNCTE|nr:ornithine--oxo-acid transaminase [Candidatus Tectomicrobia bacterium]
MQTQDYLRQMEQYSARNYRPLPVVLARGEGAFVWDVEGKRYIDMLSSYSALNHGHRHPRLIRALTEQAARLTLTSRAFHNDQLGPWCEELAAYARMEMVLPMNTGAEAVETALKLARKWAYAVKGIPLNEAEIIVCANNFHGRTITVVSFSTEELYRKQFGPFTPGFQVIPYGNAAAFESALSDRTAAFLVEPIQGEAGILVPPAGYLQTVRELCTRHRVLLLADEIQTGLGRTGARFCSDHEGVRPDILILGKALGGGIFPISAIAGSRELLGLFVPGEHGSTFGGNPLACAISREALRVLEEEHLAESAATLGRFLMGGLREAIGSQAREIRGKGLLIGVEVADGNARAWCERLFEVGILCKETHETVIRFAPPLVVSEAILDEVLSRIARVFSE